MNSTATIDADSPPTRHTSAGTPQMLKLSGRVTSGRGISAVHNATYADEIREALGEAVVHGSLNVLLQRPVMLRQSTAIQVWFARHPHLYWPARLNGVDVWIHRWHTAPLHIAELLCTVHLRTHLRLSDGDDIRLDVRECDIAPLSRVGRLTWFLCWFGRTSSTYRDTPYHAFVQKWSERYGATQLGTNKGVLDLVLAPVKTVVKGIPGARRLWRRLRSHSDRAQIAPEAYLFERLPLDHNDLEPERSVRQIRNLLNYTKTSGSLYSGKHFPAGYHTLEINGQQLLGKRNPAERLKCVPFDFDGKTVLDVGCNQGGMLFQLPGIKWGVGVDYDPRMINVANRIRDFKGLKNLGFYVVDLEKDPLDLIEDFIPELTVDIVFLLAVCGWLSNWKQVIDWCARISGSMLYETTGSHEFQDAQVRYLTKVYQGGVTLLAERSEDDPQFKTRQLFYCCADGSHHPLM